MRDSHNEPTTNMEQQQAYSHQSRGPRSEAASNSQGLLALKPQMMDTAKERRNRHPLQASEWQILTNEIDMLLRPEPDTQGHPKPAFYSHNMMLITRLLVAPTGFTMLTRLGNLLHEAKLNNNTHTCQLSMEKLIWDVATLNGQTDLSDHRKVCKTLSADRDILYLSGFDSSVSWRMPNNESTRQLHLPIYRATNGQPYIALSSLREELTHLQNQIPVCPRDTDEHIVTLVISYAEQQLSLQLTDFERSMIYNSVKEPFLSEAFWKRIHGAENIHVQKAFVRDSAYALCRLGLFHPVITFQPKRLPSTAMVKAFAQNKHTKLVLPTREGGDLRQHHQDSREASSVTRPQESTHASSPRKIHEPEKHTSLGHEARLPNAQVNATTIPSHPRSEYGMTTAEAGAPTPPETAEATSTHSYHSPECEAAIAETQSETATSPSHHLLECEAILAETEQALLAEAVICKTNAAEAQQYRKEIVYNQRGEQVMPCHNLQFLRGKIFDRFGTPCDLRGISTMTTTTPYTPSLEVDHECIQDLRGLKMTPTNIHVVKANLAMKNIITHAFRTEERELENFPNFTRGRVTRGRINRATGLQALRCPATIDMQLQLLASPKVADNTNFVCLQYQEDSIVMRIIAAALEARGYDAAHAHLISDMVRWLSEHGTTESHEAVIGIKHKLTSNDVVSLGFGETTAPHDWHYGHLCYIEAVLGVSIHVLGLEPDYDGPWEDRLNPQIEQAWALQAQVPSLCKWKGYTTCMDDYDWRPLTHRLGFAGITNPVFVGLVPRFEPALEALMEMPARFTVLKEMRTAKGLKALPPLDSIIPKDTDGNPQLFIRKHVDVIIDRSPKARFQRKIPLPWDSEQDMSQNMLKRNNIDVDELMPGTRHELYSSSGMRTMTYIYPRPSTAEEFTASGEIYVPDTKRMQILWNGSREFPENREGLPFHSITKLLLSQKELDAAQQPMIREFKDNNLGASEKELQAYMLKNHHGTSHHVLNSNKYIEGDPNVSHDDPFIIEEKKGKYHMEHARAQMASLKRNLAKYDWDSISAIEWTFRRRPYCDSPLRPTMPWSSDFRENQQKLNQLVSSLPEMEIRHPYHRAAPLMVPSQIVKTTAPQSDRRITTKETQQEGLPHISKKPKCKVTIDLSEPVARTLVEPAEEWLPVQGCTHYKTILYNKQLKLYKYEAYSETYTRQPGLDLNDSGKYHTAHCNAQQASRQFKISLGPSVPPYLSSSYMDKNTFHKRRTEHSEADLRSWLSEMKRVIQAQPAFKVPFKLQSARDYVDVIYHLRYGFRPQYAGHPIPSCHRFSIGEPFIYTRHITEAVIHPTALAASDPAHTRHILTQLTTDVLDERKYNTSLSVIMEILHAAEIHFNLHLSSSPAASPHYAYNLKTFLEEWLLQITHLPCGG